MRLVLPLVLGLAVAACSTPSRWERPGMNDTAAANDLTDCRHAAQEEVARTYVFTFPFPYPLGWGGSNISYTMWRQRFESDRAYAESRLTDGCMRGKGYALVPVGG